MQDPLIGDRKSGNLGGIRVYKFKMVNQLNLLAYSYEDEVLTLTLLALGSHEKDGVENMEVVLKAVQN
jgi:hypothetical protein